MREIHINVYNNMRIVIIIIQWSGEGDLVRMIQNAYYAIFFFIRGTQYIANE